MDRRAEAVGKNEALFREVNERIRDISGAHRGAEFLCECGDPTCALPISLELDEYESVRSDPAQFVIVPRHEAPDVEYVVLENERYAVVRKRAGEPERLAARTHPRG